MNDLPLSSAEGISVASGEVPAAISDIGCSRELNEDRYAVVDGTVGRTWILCDGMGGCVGGDLAAQLAIDSIRRRYEIRDYTSAEEAILDSIAEANRTIVLRRQNPVFSSMGTTVVGATINQDEIIITHVGDSRAYIVRGKGIQQLTVDHTYVQELVDKGEIQPEEAMAHPQAHVLTKCLGANLQIEPDIKRFWVWPAEVGETFDKLFMCTDGLYSLVSDDEIAELVSGLNPQQACFELVELAKNRGGYDNISVMIIPLAGQVKEEPNPNRAAVRQKVKKKGKTDVFYFGRQLSVTQQLVLLFAGLLFGSVMSVLIWAVNYLL